MAHFWQSIFQALSPAIIALATWVGMELSGLLRRRAKDAKPHRPLEEIHQEDMDIKLRLERVRDRLNAMRTYLSQYSNGEQFISDRDIVKKSRSHEVVRMPVSYQQEVFRSILTSDIPDETALVMPEGPSFTRVRDLPLGKFRWLCEQGGAIAIARCAIRQRGKLVGFIGADFDTDTPPANIDELCHLAYEIGQILAA